MTKPVDRAELTSLLRNLLSRDGPILLVEDDTATRDTVRNTIERMGLTVAEVQTGGWHCLGLLKIRRPP